MPSIEALAMAGVDCGKCSISLEERERRDREKTPPYLLAEPEPAAGNDKMEEIWKVKVKMEVLAKAVTSSIHIMNNKGKSM
ncbi:hypothetical protein JCGZ_24020 [Jatropha curcas]|uniref:Uncharacterized protein n=1 Tax=Jatropha curcas TaxID=180498 RepID=A0A067LEC2_JATCU|nr:hypothetical protein JCGZ_24020 [Jatropha curcas]